MFLIKWPSYINHSQKLVWNYFFLIPICACYVWKTECWGQCLLYYFLLKIGHYRPLFLYFCLFNTVDSRQYSIKTLSMKGFEPRTSCVGSDSFCQLSHNHCPTYYYFYSSRKSFTGTFSAYVEIFWLKCWYKLHTEFLVDKSFMEESAGVNVWKELFKIF